MVRLSSCHSPSLTQMTARKQLRKHIRRIREREYSKLRALVPAVATKKKVTKVQVIEEAVRYIEELHTALVERFRQKHGCGAESMAQETVRSFVTQMMPPVRPHSAHMHTHSHPHPHPQSRPHPHQSHPHSSRARPHPSMTAVPFGHPAVQPVPPTPVPAFLSVCSFEKQRKRASFLLKKRRRDC